MSSSPSASGDPPCRRADAGFFFRGSKSDPLMWCENSKKGCQLRCRPRHAHIHSGRGLDTHDFNQILLLDICHGRKLENERQMLVYLVFEHVDQDLATYLERCPSPGLSPEKIKDLFFQLLNGLDFLHFNRVLHRDLKPQNILVSNQGIVKLADFGLARIYSGQIALTSVVVTLWYRPPEVLLYQAYASAVDVWSSGCILAELYKREPLFPGENEVDQLGKIFEVIGSPKQSEWPKDVSLPWTSFKFYKGVPLHSIIPGMCPEGIDLLKQMLCFNPVDRISCETALKHPYFRDVTMSTPITNHNISNAYKTRPFKV
ncbi:hypothetical protein TNCV_4811361 [Trichonephila clavipes]|nr:hypothetical protein TNCV_4811361 [Trichonephila clavipes]